MKNNSFIYLLTLCLIWISCDSGGGRGSSNSRLPFRVSIKNVGEKVRKLVKNDSQGPEIQVLSPQPKGQERGLHVVANDQPTKVETMEVTGVVRDPSGIREIDVNGKKFKGNSYAEINFSLKVAKNADINIKAMDRRGNITEMPLSVMVNKSEKPLPITPSPSPKEIDGKRRIALIVGNSNYKSCTGLGANPLNDAQDMKNALIASGFSVLEYEDVSYQKFKEVINDFGDSLKQDAVGLFFYAGHAVQSKGANYLLPVDANPKKENDIVAQGVNLDDILGKMEDANCSLNLIFLDACRDNPFKTGESRSIKASGLAVTDAPIGSLVAYSTSPGKGAYNGTGRNGLYTEELLRNIQTQDLKLEEVLKRTRISVIEKSKQYGEAQVPWDHSSLTGDFYFKRTSKN
jgi:hypothetical protein